MIAYVQVYVEAEALRPTFDLAILRANNRGEMVPLTALTNRVAGWSQFTMRYNEYSQHNQWHAAPGYSSEQATGGWKTLKQPWLARWDDYGHVFQEQKASKAPASVIFGFSCCSISDFGRSSKAGHAFSVL